MTKRQSLEMEEARKELLEILKPGDTVYCVLRHTSCGMSYDNLRRDRPVRWGEGLAMTRDWPLILLVALVWIYLLVQSVVKETRQECAPPDNPVVQVWEAGKGHRPATAEETAYDTERGKEQ